MIMDKVAIQVININFYGYNSFRSNFIHVDSVFDKIVLAHDRTEVNRVKAGCEELKNEIFKELKENKGDYNSYVVETQRDYYVQLNRYKRMLGIVYIKYLDDISMYNHIITGRYSRGILTNHWNSNLSVSLDWVKAAEETKTSGLACVNCGLPIHNNFCMSGMFGNVRFTFCGQHCKKEMTDKVRQMRANSKTNTITQDIIDRCIAKSVNIKSQYYESQIHPHVSTPPPFPYQEITSNADTGWTEYTICCNNGRPILENDNAEN